MELGDSGWGLERCAFSRLLERLLEVPGAARLVLNYLGELDQEPELEPDANVIAVLLSTQLGEEELECSAALVQDAAARGDPDLSTWLTVVQGARRCTWQAPTGG